MLCYSTYFFTLAVTVVVITNNLPRSQIIKVAGWKSAILILMLSQGQIALLSLKHIFNASSVASYCDILQP